MLRNKTGAEILDTIFALRGFFMCDLTPFNPQPFPFVSIHKPPFLIGKILTTVSSKNYFNNGESFVCISLAYLAKRFLLQR